MNFFTQIEHFQQSFETLQARNKQIEQNNQIKIKENHDLLTQISNLQVKINLSNSLSIHIRFF